MYLVELRPGKEELYRSSDDLALAVRNGEVDDQSRIYHRSTAKWISIRLHPEYKSIVAAARGEPRVHRRGWSILGGDLQEAGVVDEPEFPAAQVLHRWRRPLTLGLAAVLLFSGIQLAFSGPRPNWAGQERTRVVTRTQQLGASHPARQITPTVPAVAQSEELRIIPIESKGLELTLADVDEVSEPVRRRARILPRAPRLRTRALRDALAPTPAKPLMPKSLEAVYARYAAAHDSARSRLEAGIRMARLAKLFAAPRLSADGGVTHTRRSLAGAANFIRIYRQQQSAIERAYQDSMTIYARENGWSPRKLRRWYSRRPAKEEPAHELISNAMLVSIDSMLGLLSTQAGAYKIRGTAIAFEDPSAGQAYSSLRRQIKEQIDAAVAAGAATSAGPAGLLLQAIGTTSLPRET